MEASPDGRWLAMGTSLGDIYLADTRAGTMSLLSSIGDGSIDGFSWSPDSAWLGWSEPVTSFGSRSRLRITKIDGEPAPSGTSGAVSGDPERTIIDVTDGRFRDESPSFTPDGKYLAFLSNRSFDPVYDGHSFDLSFPSPIKPYLVALAADTPSPFGPTVALSEDAEDAEGPEQTGAAASGDAASGPGRRRRPGPPRHQRSRAAGQLLLAHRHGRSAALAGQRTVRRHG
jgi:tricorn protease